MRGTAFAAIAVCACFQPSPPAGAACAAGSACPSGLACIAGACVPPGTPVPDAPHGDRDAAVVDDAPTIDAAAAGIALVQVAFAFGAPWSATGTTEVVALPRPAAPGDVLAVFFSHDDASGQAKLASLADDGSDAFVGVDLLDDLSVAQTGLDAYAVVGSAGASTVTATLTTAACCRMLVVYELSGVSPTAPLDAHRANAQAPAPTTAGAITSGVATTTAADDFVLGVSSDTAGGGKQSITSDGSAVETIAGATTGGGALASEALVLLAPGAVASQFTYATSGDRAQSFELAFRALPQ